MDKAMDKLWIKLSYLSFPSPLLHKKWAYLVVHTKSTKKL